MHTPSHINKSGSILALNVSRTDVSIQKMDLRDKNIVEIIAKVIEEGKTRNKIYGFSVFIYSFCNILLSMLYAQLQTRMITKKC